MEKSVKISVGVSPGTLEKLDRMCHEKGVRRPAVIAFAIDRLWKEEHGDEK